MRRSKFGNKKSRCRQGHAHDSKLEARDCNHLGILERAGDIHYYEAQPNYNLIVNWKVISEHRPDFMVQPGRAGNQFVIDSKGRATPDWSLKAKLFMVTYPHIPYILSMEKHRYLLSISNAGRLTKKKIDLFQYIEAFKSENK